MDDVDGGWDSRNFGSFSVSWCMLAGAQDGPAAQVNLFLYEQPLQSFRLNRREPRGVFNLELRGDVARGEVKFWNAPDGGPCLGLAKLLYGPAGRLSEVTDCVLECKSEPPAPPAPEEPGDTAEEVVEDSGRYHDLFPFLYMYPWPQLSAEQLDRRFVVYDSADAPAGSLYCALVHIENPSEPCGPLTSPPASPPLNAPPASNPSGPPPAGVRLEMELTANAFLEGLLPFEGQFVARLTSLVGPIQDFWRIDEWLRTDPPVLDNEALLRFVEERLKGPASEYVSSAVYLSQKERLWQSLFALTIILGYRTELLDKIVTTLVMCRLVERVGAGDPALGTSEGILEAARATILLPPAIFPLPPSDYETPPVTPSADRWVKPYAIGDLKVVRHRLLRYELGEVAHIESILRGERKEATQRKLRRVKETAEVEDTRSELDESEQVGTRVDLLRETQRTIAQDSVTTSFNKLTTTYGTPTTATLDGSWSVQKGSQPPRQGQARSFAQDVTTRAADRLSRKVLERRAFSTLDESEEAVVHTFDNTDGTDNVVGIYRWVNKVYRARMVNNGRRLLIEFMVPRPALNYIERVATLQGVTLVEPTPPSRLAPPLGPVRSYEEITRANYAALAALYQAWEIAAPPAAVRVVPTTVQGGVVLGTREVAVPAGYRAVEASVTYMLAGTAGVELLGVVGNNLFSVPPLATSPGLLPAPGAGTGTDATPLWQCTPANVSAGDIQAGTQCFGLSGEDSFVPVSLMEVQPAPNSSPPGGSSRGGDSAGGALTVYGSGQGYLANVEIKCVLSDEKFAEWQIKTYEAIVRAYQRQKAEYYAQAGSRQSGRAAGNPLANREVEREELRRGCERVLLEQMYTLVGPPPVPPVTDPAQRGAAAEFAFNELRYLQFFEHAFEWGEMAYYFYARPDGAWPFDRPPYWELPENDSLFTSFLQADAARVVLPARPSFERRVLFFLATGMIWDGRDTLAPAVESNLSIYNELKEAAEAGGGYRPEGEAWEVLVPTSMTMLQRGSQLPRFRPPADEPRG